MPIMYEPSRDNGHQCRPPSSHYNRLQNMWRSDHNQGTLWKCRKCGKYWESRKNYTLLHWYPVKDWDTEAMSRIAEIETRSTVDDRTVGSVMNEMFQAIWNAITFGKG